MNKGKKIFLIMLMLVATLFLSSCTQVNANKDEKIDFKIEPIKLFNDPLCINKQKLSNYLQDSGWPQIYDKGIEDCANALTMDSEGNIIVAGYSGYITDSLSEELDFLTVKYDTQGNEIWNVTYDSGYYDLGWDIAVDSLDNIILYGFNWSSYGDQQDLKLYLRVVKFDKNGVYQWNRSYHNAINNFPGGIKVDSNDNIIISGGYGNLDDLVFSLWALKMDNDGTEIWNQTFTDDLISIGTDVALDSNDNIIVGGISASFFGQGYNIVKYDSNGTQISAHRYNMGTQPNSIALDQEENMILSGLSYSSESETGSWFTLKCDKAGNLLWTRQFDSGSFDAAEDVAIDSKGNIITVGSSWFSGEKVEQCAIIYDKDGNEKCLKRSGVEGVIYGILIDNNDNIYITGAINQSFDYSFYTDLYDDITPPSIQMTKPVENYLYILNTKFIPLTKNTIILGKITISIEADDPNDVMKVEFYTNYNLKETLTELDYEWTWSGGALFSKIILNVMAYDEFGNAVRYELMVWKPF